MLRPYQKKLYQDTRTAFRKHKSVLMQLPTGAGKTIMFSLMCKSSLATGRNIWILVPRNELLKQASEQLQEINVSHGIIAPGYTESKAYKVHVVSKDTLIRRYDKIKTFPDFCIIDECHLALTRYKEIVSYFPNAKVLGVTATPERLDGRGLAELYNTMVLGPSIKELIEQGYLSEFKYFCPPIQGLDTVKKRGTEFNPDELENLLLKRQIYGSAIQHYKKHADGKPALVFCRSIKSAAETADRFSDAGYRFENIDGTMSYKKRKTLIDGLKDGSLQGLTSCEIVTYGLDIPKVECIIMLRPTLSRTLYFQMIGRGLRPYPGKQTTIILDHVNNLVEHGHPLTPYQWQFYGREKRKRRKEENREITVRLCPDLDFMYCDKPTCSGCKFNASNRRTRPGIDEIDGSLIQVESPVEWNLIPPDEQREWTDKINEVKQEYYTNNVISIDPGAVGKMLDIADKLGRNPLWVYHQFTEDRYTVNVPLLHEIARQKKYKPGWVYFQKKVLSSKLSVRSK